MTLPIMFDCFYLFSPFSIKNKRLSIEKSTLKHYKKKELVLLLNHEYMHLSFMCDNNTAVRLEQNRSEVI